MKTKWSALLTPILLVAGWAGCGSERDTHSTAGVGAGTGDDSGGAAGAVEADVHAGAGGKPSSAGASHGPGAVSAGNGGAAAGEAGSPGGVAGDPASGGTAGVGDAAGSAGWPEAGSAGEPGEPGPFDQQCMGCALMEVKQPAWRVVSAIMAGAPIGPNDPSSHSFGDWLASLLAPNHVLIDYYIGPGVPHAPPYDSELSALFEAAQVTKQQSFSKAEFGAPNGVALLLVLAPNADAPQGTSADFDSGPIMPNALFPLYVDGDLYRNGDPYDPQFDGFYVGYDEFTPPIAKDGPSHYILAFGENSSYVPNVEPTGSYVFRIQIRDTSNAGWTLDVPFTVE